MNQQPAVIYRTGAVRDARDVDHRPGAVAVHAGRIVAVGDPDHVRRRYGQARIVDLPDALVMPAMVNAHAHLGLTDLGRRPYGGDFVAWLHRVIREAPGPTDEAALAAAVRHGAAISQAAGVAIVGDIAAGPVAVNARMRTGLAGVSYLECFGIGRRQAQAIDDLIALLRDPPFALDHPLVRIGIQPHAPYSVGRDLYHAAAKLGRERAYSLGTHLAETREEIQFVRDGSGPFVNMLRDLGKLDDSIAPGHEFGPSAATGLHPIDWLADELKHSRWLLAHCNYVEDAHIELLARTGTSVAYCPIASEYFGHRGHRYRDMLDAGVNVCLGTDSIICQPADEPQPLGILPQMRRLYRRDRVDPQTLLRMATIHGLDTMSLDEGEATLAPHSQANLIAVRFDPQDKTDALVQVLRNNEPARPLAGE